MRQVCSRPGDCEERKVNFGAARAIKLECLGHEDEAAERGIATADTPTLNQFGATVMQAMTYIDKGSFQNTPWGKDNKSRKADNLI